MATLEEVLAELNGEQMRVLALKVWSALGGKDQGEANIKKLLAGRGRLVFDNLVELLFDRHGRRIPAGLRAAVVDANRSFYLNQPNLNVMETYSLALVRLQTYLTRGPFISAADFASRSLELVAAVEANPQLANLMSGVCLPFCLPQMKVEDYGETLETFLNAFGQSYVKEFPGRSFTNYHQGELKGQVKVVKNTRHEEFLAKLAQGTVVGLYFPTALQGYSIPAACEQMTTLPPEVLLAGGLDIVANLIMHPDILARDWNTPGLDIAALSWGSAGKSFYFGAIDDCAYFDGRSLDADSYYSSGVVILG